MLVKLIGETSEADNYNQMKHACKVIGYFQLNKSF